MARRWTAVDRETGEIIEYASRSAMRQAVRANPVLKSREREDVWEHRQPAGSPRINVGPLWASQHWTADTVSLKRERAFDNATAGLRYSFLKAVTAKDAAAATAIREGWERNAKAYAEGKISADAYTSGMKELTSWLFTTPYAPPVAIWYHEGSSDDDVPDYDDFDEDFDYEV